MSGYKFETEEVQGRQRGRKELISLNMLDSASRGNFSGYGIIDDMINMTISKLARKCKARFGLEMIISPSMLNQTDREELYKFFSTYSHQFRKKYTALCRQNRVVNSNNDYITNDSFVIPINDLPATYIFLKIGQCYRDTLVTARGAVNALLTDVKFNDSDMHLYIFGRYSYQCAATINSIINGREDNTFRMYNVQGDKNSHSDVAFKSLYQDMEKRKMETIFMEPGVIETITDHIDHYLSNEHLYSGRGIIYKTGILLYGEPGTGKTSLLKALASKYGYDLILIDMTSFDAIALDTLTHSINIDDEKYIIALEDIDCVIANRENKDADKEDKRIINKLLQFLDSNSSPNEIIFIATTNHLELLDEALLREGRFDIKVEIGGIKRQKAIEMCKSFNLTDSEINLVMNQVKEMGIDLDKQTIRQSKLQTLILKTSGLSLKAEEEDIEDNATKITNSNGDDDNGTGE